MKRSLKWKIVFLLVLVAFSGITLLPSFYKGAPEWWKKYLAPEGLRLGLDLQGGMHLVLRVDLDKAIENTLDLAAADLKNALAEKGITAVRTKTGDPRRILFTLPNTGALATVREVGEGEFPNLDIQVQAEEGSFPRILLSLKAEEIDFINKNAVAQSLEIIRNRIDEFGVAEPVIIRQGKDEIVVQLPGVKDPERAMSLIGQTAQLEFKMVADEAGLNLQQLIDQAAGGGQWSPAAGYSKENRQRLNLALRNQLPPDTQIYFEKQIQPDTKREYMTPLLVRDQVMMTGDMVKSAQVRIGGQFNEPYVSLDLTSHGGRVFGQITETNVNKRFAIILDDVVRSAPVIREKILGGRAQISGSFTYEEASDLAIVLRVGALPAPVSIIQNLTVGASLGQDSIDRGLMSGLLGAFLVMVFMIVYYRRSGLIADGALLLNILFLFAGLAALSATLTLPGIAGIILAIGMAVDSNVLIFERMREEFALGKSVKSGIEGGYAKALSTVVDSQVTTLITALALFLFGTGPIKGFAVTLSLGVSINLFTTLFGTRLVYDVMHAKRWLKPLTFVQFIKATQIDFMKVKKGAAILSGLLVLCGLVAFAQIGRGQANLGVDFAGGTLIQYQADESFNLNEVRQILAASGRGDMDLQEVTDEHRLIVKLKKSEAVVGDLADEVTTLLNRELPEKNFVMESQSAIGSSVSEVLRNKALLAIVISLAGVILYLAIRFDLTFGLAAAVTTFHDVIAVLGICWLLNIEVNLLLVTALLTLAGYSLNDTVVVFDRIRENLHKKGQGLLADTPFDALINLSINEMLSRTVIASLTTILALLALFFFGGSVIHDFSFALIVGIVVGTYSSIFVASPLLDLWRKQA